MTRNSKNAKKGSIKSRLSESDLIFIHNYMLYRNKGRAYLAAHPEVTYNTARVEGCKLFKLKKIQDEIEKRMAEIEEAYNVDLKKCISELSRIGFANIMNYITVQEDGTARINFSDINHDQGAAIQQVTIKEYMDGPAHKPRAVKEIKFKLHDKRAALVDLGRHFGGFLNKVEHSGSLDIIKTKLIPIDVKENVNEL